MKINLIWCFLNNGILRFVNSSGAVVWQSNTAGRGVSSATLDNSSNFVLRNSTSLYASGAPVQFLYKELQRTTKGFKEKLGARGFGAIYRGVLANKTIIAVKQLEGIEQGEKQFRMEVATISSTHYLNIVRLIGFCSEDHHRLLKDEKGEKERKRRIRNKEKKEGKRNARVGNVVLGKMWLTTWCQLQNVNHP
ncbi:hypothetical protein ACSBR1_043344 [Camellia fascicularis]